MFCLILYLRAAGCACPSRHMYLGGCPHARPSAPPNAPSMTAQHKTASAAAINSRKPKAKLRRFLFFVRSAMIISSRTPATGIQNSSAYPKYAKALSGRPSSCAAFSSCLRLSGAFCDTGCALAAELEYTGRKFPSCSPGVRVCSGRFSFSGIAECFSGSFP